jgi:hypothetical protein
MSPAEPSNTHTSARTRRANARRGGDGETSGAANGRHGRHDEATNGSGAADPERQLDAPSEEFHGTGHGTAHGQSAERRPPQRVGSAHDEYDDISMSGDGAGAATEEEQELTPEEIAKETERWAPKTIRDTVVDVEKVCRVCGKNLKGHRRYKDEKGYICVSCDRDERLRRIPCAECGKPVPPEALRPWGPISICTRCWADHESDPKMRIKRKVSSRPWEEMERKTVLITSAVLGGILFVLFIISLLL